MMRIKSPLNFLKADNKIIGKLFYLIFFYFLKMVFFLRFFKQVEIWPRNSLFQNYFGFLKSDLDISMLFFDKKNFIQHAIHSKKILRFFPLIKEANYYSYHELEKFIQYANIYELQRDPILFSLIGKSFQKEKHSANLVVYLLRTFLSNRSGFSNPSVRDLSKWSYHLNHIQISSKNFSSPEQSLKEVLFSYFKNDNAFNAINEFNINKNKGLADHLSFDESNYAKELFVLFPHMFTYKEVVYNWDFTEVELNCITAQISWEIWAMYTQIDMILSKHQSHEHYSNISRFLKHLHLKYQIKVYDEMIVSIDEWLRM